MHAGVPFYRVRYSYIRQVIRAFSVNSVVTGDRVDRKTPHAFARSLWRIASIAPYELSRSRYCI